jgi:hypothetical protein
MKTKQILLSLITFIAFYLSACQKDFTIENNVVSRVDSLNNPVAGDSVYLDSYYYIEINATGLNGFDTGTRAHYYYDNLKRVKTVIDTSNEPFYQIIKLYSRIEYFYNGTDSLPYKAINYGEKIGGPYPHKDTLSSFYIYDTNGQLVIDSTISAKKTSSTSSGIVDYEITKKIKKFTYNSNKIYNFQQETNLLGTISIGLQTIIKDTAVLDGIGNILSVNSSSTQINPSITTTYSSATYNYDNKPSPVSRLNIKKLYNYDYIGNDIDYTRIGFTSFNNILKIHSVFGSVVNDYDLTNGYSYKLNGFPFLALINYPGTFNYTDKHIYIYKAL